MAPKVHYLLIMYAWKFTAGEGGCDCLFYPNDAGKSERKGRLTLESSPISVWFQSIRL